MKDDDNHILLLEKGKRGLLQIIFGRTGIIIVSLIVQILFLFAAFYKLEGFLPYFWGGNTLLSAAVVLFLFGNDDNPTIKLTWFFILAVLPVFGLILYVYIKTDLGHRLMIRRYNDILSQTEHFAPSESACSKEELPDELQSLASYLNSCGFPCYQNTQAQYFPRPHRLYPQYLRLSGLWRHPGGIRPSGRGFLPPADAGAAQGQEIHLPRVFHRQGGLHVGPHP